MVPSRKLLAGMVALIVLVIAGVSLFRQMRHADPPSPSKAWFYDLNTGKLFSGPAGALPPVVAPSGPLPDGTPAGVQAHVYSCTDCAEATRYIAYLETSTASARERQLAAQQSKEPLPAVSFMPGEGILVKRPGDKDWVERNSSDGQQILRELSQPCGSDKYARSCWPKE